MASACALAIFSGKIILFRNSGASADAPLFPFHENFSYAKRLPHAMCSSLLFVYPVILSGITPR